MKNRQPRKGELNYELEKILEQECTYARMKKALPRIRRRIKALPKSFGIFEFEVNYNEHETAHVKGSTEQIVITVFRERSNRTTVCHKAVLTVQNWARAEFVTRINDPHDLR